MTTFQVRAQFFVKPINPTPQRGWKLDTLQTIVIVDAESEEEAVKLVTEHLADGIPPGEIRGQLIGRNLPPIMELLLTDPAPFDDMAEPEEPAVP